MYLYRMSFTFRIYFWLLWAISGSLAVVLGGDYQESWNQWRGPDRDGHYHGKDWPNSLQPNLLKLDWSENLDASYSSPVVDLTTIYTSESKEGDIEQVKAYDRKKGELRWTASWDGGMKVPFFARANGSWIRSTPVLSNGYLYIMGMQERLICIRTTDGQISWELDIPFKLGTPDPSFGGVSSPMIHKGNLYVQAGGGLIKVDPQNGKLLWSSLISNDAMNQSPFGSPRVYTFGDSEQLVSLGRTALVGTSLDNGNTLWEQKVPAFRGMNILTPTFVGSGILTATYGGKAHLFEPTLTDDESWQVEEKWNQKFQGYMSSPVVVDQYAYLHGRSGRLVCLDIHSGEIKWTSTESLGKYCSMVTNGEKVLALSSNGKLRLLAASPEKYEVLDSIKISKGETWAHIGLADNQVFIRALNSLNVYRWGKGISTEQASLGNDGREVTSVVKF
jgi:outer membrane protein assembly factor BamB